MDAVLAVDANVMIMKMITMMKMIVKSVMVIVRTVKMGQKLIL